MDGELRSLRGRGNGRGGRAGGQPWLGPVHLSELRGQRSKRDARPPADAVIAAVSQTQGWILITIGLVIAVVVIARA